VNVFSRHPTPISLHASLVDGKLRAVPGLETSVGEDSEV